MNRAIAHTHTVILRLVRRIHSSVCAGFGMDPLPSQRMTGVILICALLILSVPVQAQESSTYDRVMETGKIRCGGVFWPPYLYKDPNTGEVKGFSKDIWEAIIALADLEMELVEVQPGYTVSDLKAKKVDAICGDGPWIISKIKYIDFTRPYSYQALHVYGRADETRYPTRADLNTESAHFVGIDGDSTYDFVNRFFPKAKIRNLIDMTDPTLLLSEVAAGKADLVVMDPLAADPYIKNNPGEIKRLLGGEPVAIYPAMFSVAKGENELFRVLDSATEAALNLGIIDDILNKVDPDQTFIFRVAKPYEVKE